MSMSNENLHTVVDTLSVIESKSLVYWQKYVSGVNLSYFECLESTVLCLPPKPDNVIRFLGHVKHTEYVAISDEAPESCYYSSLIVPIFQQLATRVNITLELMVSRGEKNVEQLLAIEHNLSTSCDRVPFIYTYESHWKGVKCAQPLYLINQLQILTALATEPNSVESMFEAFSLNIWYIILGFFLLCVSLDLLLNRRYFNGNRLWHGLINYFKVLLAKESQNAQFSRWLFIFWVLGCIPLVEIFRNDMIAKIVENKYLYINTIEDVLKTKMTGLATAGDMALWTDKNFISMKNIDYESFRENARLLFNRTEWMFFDDPKWLDLFNNPKLFIDVFRKTFILEDEFAIKFFAQVLGEIMPIHLSRESYFPEYVTPICYIKNFPYEKQLEKLTRELFEKGFLMHWNNLKHNYYGTFGKRIFKLLAGEDVLDRINVELNQATEQQTMTNLVGYIFKLYLVLTIINCTVFAVELAYYFFITRLQWPTGKDTVFAEAAKDNDRLKLYSGAERPVHSSVSY